MSIRKRKQLKFRRDEKRRKKRAKIKAAGKNPDELFSSGIYLGRHSS
ncbi:MAG: hypothetical protein U9R52_00145 [Candidatus Omnitrophota bacterium]|nr:hypothetical protein [Candidatus Omnitrophota bacterium]